MLPHLGDFLLDYQVWVRGEPCPANPHPAGGSNASKVPLPSLLISCVCVSVEMVTDRGSAPPSPPLRSNLLSERTLLVVAGK